MSGVTYQVSHVRCHMSFVMCHVSCVIFYVSYVIYIFFLSRWVGWLRLCYQQGLTRLSFRFFLIKNALIPNIYLSRLVVVRFGSLKKANWWESNFRVIGLFFQSQKWNQYKISKLRFGYFPLGLSVAFLWLNQILKFLKIWRKKLKICWSFQICTGIILLELSSEGLFIQMKKIFCCLITLICTTIKQCLKKLIVCINYHHCLQLQVSTTVPMVGTWVVGNIGYHSTQLSV